MCIGEYNQNMSDLCRRASVALLTTCNYVTSDIYKNASDGFYQKFQTLPTKEAVKPLDGKREARFKQVIKFVERCEESAAYYLKGAESFLKGGNE